jgi:hypothetical protein
VSSGISNAPPDPGRNPTTAEHPRVVWKCQTTCRNFYPVPAISQPARWRLACLPPRSGDRCRTSLHPHAGVQTGTRSMASSTRHRGRSTWAGIVPLSWARSSRERPKASSQSRRPIGGRSLRSSTSAGQDEGAEAQVAWAQRACGAEPSPK